MHQKKLIYDFNTRQVKFADEQMNTISATKQITISAMTSSIISTKFNVITHPDKTYIAMIHCPGSLTLTGVPSIVNIDDNQICKIVNQRIYTDPPRPSGRQLEPAQLLRIHATANSL